MPSSSGSAPTTWCPRCGSRRAALPSLARLAERLVGDAVRARDDLAVAQRALPASVPAALAGLAWFGPDLVQGLRCQAGACAAVVGLWAGPPGGTAEELTEGPAPAADAPQGIPSAHPTSPQVEKSRGSA